MNEFKFKSDATRQELDFHGRTQDLRHGRHYPVMRRPLNPAAGRRKAALCRRTPVVQFDNAAWFGRFARHPCRG